MSEEREFERFGPEGEPAGETGSEDEPEAAGGPAPEETGTGAEQEPVPGSELGLEPDSAPEPASEPEVEPEAAGEPVPGTGDQAAGEPAIGDAEPLEPEPAPEPVSESGSAPEEAPDEPPASRVRADEPPTDWDYPSDGSGPSTSPDGSDGEGGGESRRVRRTVIGAVVGVVAVIAVVVVVVIALWPCDHEWAEATCTEPATCTKCGETEGEPLGHDWEEATCTEPETCARCGETEGEALGHDWEDATCTEPATCSVCGETEGDALGHTVVEWTVTLEPTCSEEGTETGICTRCGEEQSQVIEPTGEHTEGEWTYNAETSQKELLCAVCGEVMEAQDAEIYPADEYVVGEDLPAGEYKLVYDAAQDEYGSGYGYYFVYSDTTLDEALGGDQFYDCMYLTVSDGQYVAVGYAVIVAIEDAEPTTDIAGEGMYKVGFDLEAGTYVLTHRDDAMLDYGVVGIYNSSDVYDVWNFVDYEDWEMFEGSYTITVSDGQYVQLQYVDIEPAG